ncbi:Microtubule-associated protein, partial [Globisporangium splendens]
MASITEHVGALDNLILPGDRNENIASSDIVLSTMTLDGIITNVKFDKVDAINHIGLTNRIVEIGCNYGYKILEEYKLWPCYKDRMSKKKDRGGQSVSRKQGLGRHFNSQITFTIVSDKDTEHSYQVKLFTNGRLQIPGIGKLSKRNDELLEDILTVMVSYINSYPKALMLNPEKPVDVSYLSPILQNYKSSTLMASDCMVETRIIVENSKRFQLVPFLDLAALERCILAYRSQNRTPLPVDSITFNPERYSGMLIKFSTPVMVTGDFKQDKMMGMIKMIYHKKARKSRPMKPDGHELASGRKDSKIMIWDSDVKPLATVDLKQQAAAVWLYNSSIRSVCTSNRSSRVFLVGTGGSDLLEVDASRSGISFNIITQGHYNMEVWGLACHPKKSEYCTVGDDQTLRVWCLRTKVQLRTKKLDCMARVCAVDDRLDAVAVGYGCRNAQQAPSKALQVKTGSIVLLHYGDLVKLFEDKPSKQPISEMKFSPNGSILAVGSHDHHIYLHKIHDASCKKVTKTATFARHQSYITHIDFSRDSKILQSNCGAYELHFSDATNGRHIMSASSTKDTQWQTWTCVLGWPVQGTWSPCSDGTDVNAVDRNSKGNLLATSDDFGLVKLYRFPCVAKNASSTENCGHSSHVTNVRWSVDDTHVISVGGNHRCIMEWKVMNDGEEGATGNRQEALHGKFSTMNNQDEDDDGDDDEDNNLMDDPSGDEFMAVKPIYDPVTHLQRHHLCHNDDIMSFTISDLKRDIVATGERGKKPVIRLWDAHTGELRCEVKGFHIRGVVSLAFSADMKVLVSVGDDDDHSVALWEDASNGSWILAKLRATSKGDKGVSHFTSFSSTSSSSAIVTGGAKHVLFWTIEGKSMTSKKGKVGKKGTLQSFPSGCVFGDEFVAGTASGELYVWRGGEVSRTVKAHEGETTVVCAHSSDKLGTPESKMSATGVLLSGGKDGEVVMWNANFQSLKCFDLVAMDTGCLQRAICSAFLSANGQKLLIGTRSSDIIEVDVSSGTLLNGGKPLFSGHYSSELWGLALAQLTRLPSKSRACAYSPDAVLFAIGLGGDNGVRRKAPRKQSGQAKSKEGAIVLLNVQTADAKVLFEDSPAKEWISEVKFSPCGRLVTFGSHDNAIYLYSLSSGTNSGAIDAKKHKPFAKHNSYITHFDFSEDSKYIQSNGGAALGVVIEGRGLGNVDVHAEVARAGHLICPECADGTDINAVCASSSRTILATGDDSSLVKIFRYPCIMKGLRRQVPDLARRERPLNLPVEAHAASEPVPQIQQHQTHLGVLDVASEKVKALRFELVLMSMQQQQWQPHPQCSVSLWMRLNAHIV